MRDGTDAHPQPADQLHSHPRRHIIAIPDVRVAGDSRGTVRDVDLDVDLRARDHHQSGWSHNSPSGPSPTSTGPLPDDPDSRHPWLTARSEEEPRQTTPGDWQEITGVRTGVHQTYDRVVLDLSGDEPLLGWFAGFTDEAIEDPTGLPLEVDGDAFLNLGIWAIDWTTDRPERYSGETVDNDELETVTQVVFGSLFEAQQQVVIGLEEQTAYRIFRLSDPARIVIDIRHD